MLGVGGSRPDARLPRPERRREDDRHARHLRPCRARQRRGALGRPADRRRRATAVRVHAGGAGPVPADASGRAARVLRAPARLGGECSTLCRIAAGSNVSDSTSGRTPRSRSSRTATSSGRSLLLHWCTSQSCSSSTNRSQGSTRSRCRRWQTCSAARLPAAPPCSSPAISSSWWRTSVKRSRSSTTADSLPQAMWRR